jgi:hypothetical protein
VTFTEQPVTEPWQLRERRAGRVAIVVCAYLLGQHRIQIVRYASAEAAPGSYWDCIGPAEF